MHVISQRCVWEAQQAFPNSATALQEWYEAISKNLFNNFAELKKSFGSVDKVGDLCIFNIGGNKLRLVAAIHFNRHKVYIRDILTHAEYDKNGWKK